MSKGILILGILCLIVFIANAVFFYLIILGVNRNKTEEERKMEDEEQMNYLKDIENKK